MKNDADDLRKKHEALTAKIDWDDINATAAKRKAICASENIIRQQFGLASREQDQLISQEIMAGWDKLCAQTDRVAQLEQQLFQQVAGEQELLRKKRADELAFMLKHESQA